MDLIPFLIVLSIFIIVTIAYTLWKNKIPKEKPTIVDHISMLPTSEKEKVIIDRISQKSSELIAKRYNQAPIRHYPFPKSVTKHGEYVSHTISSNFMDESPVIVGISDVVFMDNLINELPVEFGGGNFGGGGAGDDYSPSDDNSSSNDSSSDSSSSSDD